MQLANAPAKIVEAFAVNAAPSGGYGGKRTVPVPSQIGITPGAASFNDGFPPATMTPLPDGGVVMSGLDMNGILNQATAIDWWASAGGGFLYDSTFSSAIGGYPQGARVLMASGNGYWLSIVDNNATDPDTGGAGWIPESKRAVASVYASGQQTLAQGGVAKVLWNTVEFDTFGLWNAGGQRFQALWAGVYKLSGTTLLFNPGGQLMSAIIYKNGVIAKLSSLFPQVSDGDLAYPFEAMVSCAVGDYLEVFMAIPTVNVLAGFASGSNQPYVYGQLEYMGT